ncbi:MoxR family ATPase [Methylocaldum sp. RMAD-M]|uniref:AAA family ATPase n=1 Tax=Methylocaldum sp. RMAD-M TaxID=2806557 RepID=UPI00197B346D|nr:MoxR family ATPase [Methylocaldum sp. RMAD-M]MBP1148704.1 MoxR-like ATPase [Methylocaldum sp. RMAD-M]MDV3240420.1 MoxR family ATPase [Methylocaldum sp.]
MALSTSRRADPDIGTAIKHFRDDMNRLCESLARVIVGQEALIRDMVSAMLAGGHVLLEGYPGLGKTHLAKGLACCIGVPMSRVQCTPDLMPADITGSEVLLRAEDDREHRLEFRPGPIFAPMVLVDEINRATPKTQAALLEAMQERQVTAAGRSHRLPDPFWLIATQNPIEIEGTFPLPEAQTDRFLFKLSVGYPAVDAMLRLIDISLDEEPTENMNAVISLQRISEMMALCREVVIADEMKRAAVSLVLATHPEHGAGSEEARRHFRYGASPRGLQALLRAARVRALQSGRGHVAADDIAGVALPALRHRVLLNIESEMDGIAIDSALERVIGSWRRSI